MSRETNPSPKPRGGQTWRRKSDGLEVEVLQSQTVKPMAAVRPHSDQSWSMLFWTSGELAGVAHESDFTQEFDFVGRTVKE